MEDNKSKCVVFVAVLALAVLGCLLCWFSPLEWILGENQHQLFIRQLSANLLGLLLFAGVWKIGWRRWLKAAPYLMALLVGLFVLRSVLGPIYGCAWYAPRGLSRFNVWLLFWPVGALFAAWLVSMKVVKPRMLLLALGFFAILLAVSVCMNGNRCLRLLAFYQGILPSWLLAIFPCDAADPGFLHQQQLVAFVPQQLRAALDVASWFGSSGHSLRYVPYANAGGVVASSALLFGKWFPACAVALMGAVAAGLVRMRQHVGDPARRLYVLLFGCVLVGTAAWTLLQTLALLPPRSFSFSWLGYGGLDVLCSWLGLGLAFSAVADGSEGRAEAGSARAPWIVAGAVSVLLVSAFFWAPTRGRGSFLKPHAFAQTVPAARGTLLAADGQTLAEDRKEWRIYVDPKAVRYSSNWTTNDVAAAVAKGLGVPVEKMREIYATKRSRYVRVPVSLDEEKLNWCRLRPVHRYGILLRAYPQRHYPLGQEAAYVTGCCIADDHCETALRGASGLEHTCRTHLKGRDGTKYSPSYVRGRREQDVAPVDGHAVRTTICTAHQKAASQILAEMAYSHHAESAWAVVVRVPGGEITAMAAWPSYDPNQRGSFVGESCVNGVVQSLHEPGDLMKPLVYALAVDAGAVQPDAVTGFGNTTFTNLCHQLGTNALWQGLAKWRVGKKLGEGSLYAEEAGIVYPPARWSPAMLDCFGKGQGLAMTGIQLAQAYATLANGGARVTPYLVDGVVDKAGAERWKHAPQPQERVVSAQAAAAVTKLLLAQTNCAARVAGEAVPAKTSTFALVKPHREHESATYSDTDFDALCAGYFPAAKPAYALVVGFRRPQPEHAAEKVARPAFERIAARVLCQE